ncbi:MAG: LLM class flavin-dependent oxidoreductase [Candidatus Bathyarchaeia archaeon]|jgi:5,10-methylenetetrahydromethanopterin reductase
MPFFDSVDVGFGDCTIRDFLSLAEIVDSMNFPSLWIQEGDQRSALALAALALQSTVRVKVGVGVTSPFRRHPQILAIESATLSQISGDRFILGLGVASGAIRNYGLRTNPLHAMQDTFEIIRGLLSDDASEFSYNGKVFSTKRPQKRLKIPNLPIYMGAIGPRMLDLAGEIADGLIMTRRGSFSFEYAKYAIERVINSANKHKRDLNKINFLGFFETCISEDGTLARQFAKRILGTYTIPELPDFVSNLAGIKEHEIRTVKQRYLQGDLEGAISAVSDEMVDMFAIAGTPSQCLEKLEQFAKTGLKTPILYIHGPDKKNAAKLAAEQMIPKLTRKSKTY